MREVTSSLEGNRAELLPSGNDILLSKGNACDILNSCLEEEQSDRKHTSTALRPAQSVTKVDAIKKTTALL